MTYDFYESWSSKSGFNSSLYKDPSDSQNLSVDSIIREYWHGTKNIPYNQLVSGIAFYSINLMVQMDHIKVLLPPHQ